MYEMKLKHHEDVRKAIEEIICASKQGLPLDDFWAKIRYELDMMWESAYLMGREEVKGKVRGVLNQF